MFKTQNFCHIASNNRNQVKVGVFVYRTTDDLATVLTSGYFNDRIIDINLHDLIIHEKVDNTDATKVERNLLCVTERTLENVGTSVIKSKWEEDIEQIIEDLGNNFVKIDGTSIMTAPLKFSAGSMRGAVGPYLNGVSFWKLDSQGNITNIANLTDSQFTPVTTNSINLGNTTHIWKDAYVARVITSVLNNGHDIAVPVTNSADTLALKSEVDLAANSGRMITDQGVWYAKMYAATVAPSAENGTNYADFSQTDGQGNPIIVIYNRVNGAWVQDQTITPPAEYDGYVPITSKIWDIVEQAGQQGGRVLWNHQSKDFTPYPQIISFENAALTGVSTAPTPTNDSPNNQIVNKEYVDNKTSEQGYHPDLFDVKWADHELDDIQWLRADTFSWQSRDSYREAYEHLCNDMYNRVGWINGETEIYTKKRYPKVGEKAYSDTALTTEVGTITAFNDSLLGEITVNNVVYTNSGDSTITPVSETIGGVTVQYIPAEDGHKICLSSQESNVAAIYAATGVAWYYIVDTDYRGRRFKLPRTKFGMTGLRDTVGKYVDAGLPNITGSFQEMQVRNSNPAATGAFTRTSNGQTDGGGAGSSGNSVNVFTTNFSASNSNSVYGNSDTVQPKATQMYLYFYVGSFTQEAVENTAGLNAELFNGKAGIDLDNLSSTGKEVCATLPMPSATYTSLTLGASGTTYTMTVTGWLSLYISQPGTYDYQFQMMNMTRGDFRSRVYQAAGDFCIYIPVIKGDVIHIEYSSFPAGYQLRLYKAMGIN
ncbi:MAG: hypothetical protein J6S85_19020 [Methanobrevibacter sp.]|nr:hypothetical protein [Methanobrevibacter sp.]